MIKKNTARELEPDRQKKKWNYIFFESLKMALFLPLVILSVEVFILGFWSDLGDRRGEFAADYLFLFSMVFLIFTVFHIIRWQKYKRFRLK